MSIVDIEYLIIFGLFAFCFCLSIQEVKTPNANSIVHPNTSVFLKALSCLVIIVHHYALRVEGGTVNKAFEVGGGTYALVIFLFLSSYGIVKSEIMHKTRLMEYANHRLWKLLLPYLFVTLGSIGLYYLIGAQTDSDKLIGARISPAFVDIGGGITFLDLCGYLFGFKSFSSSMWFVGVTFYSYVAFGIAKFIGTSDCKFDLMNKKAQVITIYTALLCAFAIFTYNFPEEFPAHYYRNLWALWLGMIAAFYEKWILSNGIFNKALSFLLMNALMVVWLTITSSGYKMYYIFANIAIISIILSNIVFRKYSLKPNSIICKLALLSYCIYLVHGKVLTVEWWYIGYNSVILVVVLCIVLSYYITNVMNYVLRK